MSKHRSTAKKGQPKRCRKGNLVKPLYDSLLNPNSYVATWDQHPSFDNDTKDKIWSKTASVIGSMKNDFVYVVINTHNLPHPCKEQYCLVLGIDGDTGWVNSRFLEKLK